MAWDLEEAMAYYDRLGARKDQQVLTELLREIQREWNGIPECFLPRIAQNYGIPESLPRALIRRYPTLRLAQSHTLELCCGPNCGKTAALRSFLEKTPVPKGVAVKFVPCMRQCGKGPNLRWDGTLYNKAEEALLRRLLKENT